MNWQILGFSGRPFVLPQPRCTAPNRRAPHQLCPIRRLQDLGFLSFWICQRQELHWAWNSSRGEKLKPSPSWSRRQNQTLALKPRPTPLSSSTRRMLPMTLLIHSTRKVMDKKSCVCICACQLSIIKLQWCLSATGANAALFSTCCFLCSYRTGERESFLHYRMLHPEYVKYVFNTSINTSIICFLEQEN